MAWFLVYEVEAYWVGKPPEPKDDDEAESRRRRLLFLGGYEEPASSGPIGQDMAERRAAVAALGGVTVGDEPDSGSGSPSPG